MSASTTGRLASSAYDSIRQVLPEQAEEHFKIIAPLVYPSTARGVPLKTRIKLYKHGFEPRSYHIYDFNQYDMDDYLSDRKKHSGDVNEPLASNLKNKYKFYELFDEYGLTRYLPKLYGELREGRISRTDTGILELLDNEKKLVVKGKTGYGGYDVNILETDGESYYINTKPVTAEGIETRAQKFDGCIVTEYCNQAKYAEELYPNTTNTIRLVTINPRDGDPFVPIAVHRIGTAESGYVDNCSQGGLTAEINDDGRLGIAAQFQDQGVQWYDSHPDSNSTISGTLIPQWSEIREEMLSIVDQIETLRYVGWDLVVTGSNSFKIIEGNNRTDLDLLQIHRPLLRDERVQAFFEEHGMA